MTIKISQQSFFAWIIRFNIVWALFLPIALAIIVSSFNIQGLFILKDIIFYTSFVLLMLLNRNKWLYSYFFMIIIFVFYLFILTAVFFELKPWIVYNLRQLISPLLIIGFGYYVTITDKERIYGIIRFLYKITIWVVVVGLFFKIFKIWDYISLANYFNLKGIPVDSRGVSYMFYEPIINYTERLVSTILDPISLGHIIAASLILCYYSVSISGKKRKWFLVLFFVGLILTFSKGAILQSVLALFFFNKKLSIVIRYLVPSLFIGIVLISINIEGILIHLVGLQNAIIYMNFFGHGLGQVGNYAKMFADDLSVYEQFKISDTFIGSVIGQLGLIGFLFWISFFLPRVKNAIFGSRVYVGSVIIISQLMIAVISENTLNFTSFVVPGIIGGLLIKNKI